MNEGVLLALKGVVSGILVVVVNIIAKREPNIGGLIVAFPVITLLSAFWLVVDHVPDSAITLFLAGVLWGLVPTFLFVLGMVLTLRGGIPLAGAVAAGALLWLVATVLIQLSGWVGS